MDDTDPRQLLALRLRALREDRWPDRRITQQQLAQALGGVSVPLISSWESQTNPRVPPLARLEAYAALFASTRSFDGDEACVIDVAELSDEERQVMGELRRELTQLRSAALRAGVPSAAPGRVERTDADQADKVIQSLYSGPWRFEDRHDITIVGSRWPAEELAELARKKYTDVSSPDFVELLTCAELDALFELHGHLRAANPISDVFMRIGSANMVPDDYSSHLVSLGGIDWNAITSSALNKLELPVRQVADWSIEDGLYFEVNDNGAVARYRPVLGMEGDRTVLIEDVALFARAVNPFNRKRSITICNGMYARGTFGAVRALTDIRFRDRNAEYLRERFAGSESYCILMRVPIVNGATLTPDWTDGDRFTLFEWQG
jgi:transcriptional regulator with XRE-family HTH domain